MIERYSQLLIEALADSDKTNEFLAALESPDAPTIQQLADVIFDENNPYFEEKNVKLFFDACFDNPKLISEFIVWFSNTEKYNWDLTSNKEPRYFTVKEPFQSYLAILRDYLHPLIEYSPVDNFDQLPLSLKALIHHKKALENIQLKQFELAIEECNQAIAIRPDAADCYDARSEAYAALNRYIDAISDINQFQKLKPFSIRPYYFRALYYLALVKGKELNSDSQANLHRGIVNLQLALHLMNENPSHLLSKYLRLCTEKNKLKLIFNRSLSLLGMPRVEDFVIGSEELPGNIIINATRFNQLRTNKPSFRFPKREDFKQKAGAINKRLPLNNLLSTEIAPSQENSDDKIFFDGTNPFNTELLLIIVTQFLDRVDLNYLGQTNFYFFNLIYNDAQFKRQKLIYDLIQACRRKGINIEANSLVDIPLYALKLLLPYAEAEEHRIFEIGDWFNDEATCSLESEAFWRLLVQLMLAHSGFSTNLRQNPERLTEDLINYRTLADMIYAVAHACFDRSVTDQEVRDSIRKLKWFIISKGFYLDIQISGSSSTYESKTYYLITPQNETTSWRLIYIPSKYTIENIPLASIVGLEDKLKKFQLEDLNNKSTLPGEIHDLILNHHLTQYTDNHLTMGIYLFSHLLHFKKHLPNIPAELLFCFRNMLPLLNCTPFSIAFRNILNQIGPMFYQRDPNTLQVIPRPIVQTLLRDRSTNRDMQFLWQNLSSYRKKENEIKLFDISEELNTKYPANLHEFEIFFLYDYTTTQEILRVLAESAVDDELPQFLTSTRLLCTFAKFKSPYDHPFYLLQRANASIIHELYRLLFKLISIVDIDRWHIKEVVNNAINDAEYLRFLKVFLDVNNEAPYKPMASDVRIVEILVLYGFGSLITTTLKLFDAHVQQGGEIESFNIWAICKLLQGPTVVLDDKGIDSVVKFNRILPAIYQQDMHLVSFVDLPQPNDGFKLLPIYFESIEKSHHFVKFPFRRSSIRWLQHQSFVKFIYKLLDAHHEKYPNTFFNLSALVKLFNAGLLKLTDEFVELILKLDPYLTLIAECRPRKSTITDLYYFNGIFNVPDHQKILKDSLFGIRFFLLNLHLFNANRANGYLNLDWYMNLNFIHRQITVLSHIELSPSYPALVARAVLEQVLKSIEFKISLTQFIFDCAEKFSITNPNKSFKIKPIVRLYNVGLLTLTIKELELLARSAPLLTSMSESPGTRHISLPEQKLRFILKNSSFFKPDGISPEWFEKLAVVSHQSKFLKKVVFSSDYNAKEIMSLIELAATIKGGHVTNLLRCINNFFIPFNKLVEIINCHSLLVNVPHVINAVILLQHFDVEELKLLRAVTCGSSNLFYYLGNAVPAKLLIEMIQETNKNIQALYHKVTSNPGLMQMGSLTCSFNLSKYPHNSLQNHDKKADRLHKFLANFSLEAINILATLILYEDSADGIQWSFIQAYYINDIDFILYDNIPKLMRFLLDTYKKSSFDNFIKKYSFNELLERGSALTRLYEAHRDSFFSNQEKNEVSNSGNTPASFFNHSKFVQYLESQARQLTEQIPKGNSETSYIWH